MKTNTIVLSYQSEIIADTGNRGYRNYTDFYRTKWKAVHFQNFKQGTVPKEEAKKAGREKKVVTGNDMNFSFQNN